MAALSIASLGAGTHSITALFVPDRPFAPSNSESLTLTVNKATGTAALSLSVLTPQYSDIETFRATFTPAVAGGPAPAKVTFKVGLQVMADAPFIWTGDRKSTRLNSSHRCISYAVFCLKKKKKKKSNIE